VQPTSLEASLQRAKSAGKHVRAIAVINPGNPTGNHELTLQLSVFTSFHWLRRQLLVSREHSGCHFVRIEAQAGVARR
jgi:hypothetical protein